MTLTNAVDGTRCWTEHLLAAVELDRQVQHDTTVSGKLAHDQQRQSRPCVYGEMTAWRRGVATRTVIASCRTTVDVRRANFKDRRMVNSG